MLFRSHALIEPVSEGIDASLATTNPWYLDSGASKHMTHHRDWFEDITSVHGRHVVCANDATQDITGVGHVPILLDGSGKKQYIRDVWYVPDLKKNLISVSSIAHDQHMLVEFQGSQCRIKDPIKGYAIVATGTYEKRLYKLDAQPYNQHAMAVSCVSQGDLWHARFGHVHHRALTYLFNNNMVIGMPKLQQPVSEVCEGCALGKLHRLPFKKDEKGDVKAIRVLQMHSDVCGPMNVNTHRGAR